MIRTVLSTAAVAFALPAVADTLASPYSVAQTMDNLVAAVEDAGATVVARVNHAEAARSVGLELPEAELLIFGNPAVGTPILQQDLGAGLVLPLRVLVHEGAEGTVIHWQSPEEMFAGLDVDPKSEAVRTMAGALDTLTAQAAE